MRLGIGHVIAAAASGLMLAAVPACGEPAPEVSAAPTAPPTTAGDAQAVCDAVIMARESALMALEPVSVTLAAQPSADDIAEATDELKKTFSNLHMEVSEAVESVQDARVKATIVAYQFAIEQAIVVVEGADGDPAGLAGAIDLPVLRSAEEEILATCE